MKISLPVKALSVNDAWRGRRFSTPEKDSYEALLALILPGGHVKPGPYYRVDYDFHLVNFAATDTDNLIKVTQDCLVKRGIITDDRKIIHSTQRKFPAKKDRIDIYIEGVNLLPDGK